MSREKMLKQRNLFQELLQLRDTQRQRISESIFVVDGEDLPWEINQMGIMKWYLHPSIEDTAIHSLIFYMQKILPQRGKACLPVS